MHIVIYVTVENLEQANKISSTLVEQKLAACVNIIDQVDSIYSWKGKIEQAKEKLLMIKTRKELFAKVSDAVKALHSYEVPEIIALPIIEGNSDYLDWIDKTTDGCL